MITPITNGVHHIGLTASKLEQSADFFISLLDWKEIRRNKDYPAIYVSDGSTMLTLWAIHEQPSQEFDKNKNVGLHHLAFGVDTEQDLNNIYDKLTGNDVKIEFSPEQVQSGPAKHLMCYDPSGIRIEFIWLGAL